METSRATLRARVRWLEEGETCSAYFFRRFRSRSSSSTTSLLRDSSGSEFSTASARHDHIRQYFTDLCAAPTFSSVDCSLFLSSITLPTLTEDQSDSLLSPFTPDELLSTIKALPPRKAPGPDGIPYEWYQTFAEPLVPILLPLFNAVLSGRSPPLSWSQTLVSLIPKPGRVHADLANWRPITLANCDVKIFSRMLASRLAHVLPDLVSPHQAGFVRDRNAADVAMALRNVLGHAAEAAAPPRGRARSRPAPVEGALVFLDQEKAYDRISHPYLRAVLNKFGFPILVQHAFAATYTNTSAFFLDDGHPVGPVSVGCGVRQGDPLAPLLFNLAFEPLLVALRKRLRGLRLPWGVYITGAYADDLGIGVALSDGRILIVTLEDYCRASNSRINFHKSVYMPLSPTATTLPPWAASLGLQFHNPRIPIRVLGYDLVLSPDGVQEDWDALYNKLESTSRNILSRHLTLQGRSLLVTSKLFSRLWYKFRLSSPPLDQLRRFTSLGWSTVWNESTALKPSMPIGRRPVSKAASTSFLPWFRLKRCKPNGSAPSSPVLPSGLMLSIGSWTNSLVARRSWPPRCAVLSSLSFLSGGTPFFQHGLNSVLIGTLTSLPGPLLRHFSTVLQALLRLAIRKAFPCVWLLTWIRSLNGSSLFRTPLQLIASPAKPQRGSSPLCNVFVTTLNLSKRYSSNPFVPNPTPSLPLPPFALYSIISLWPIPLSVN